MPEKNIQFKKLNVHDLKLLYKWFRVPHILKWYARGDKYTFKRIQEKYLPRINDATIKSFIIFDDEKAVGYIQLYRVADHLPEGICSDDHPIFDEFNPEDLAGIDLFIADKNYLGTGFSSEALELFINKYVKNKCKAILVDPLKQNIIAISFFRKNSFRCILSQDANHDLLIRDMKYTTTYFKRLPG